MMQTGLGLLQLPPALFWAMTPKELECAITGLTGQGTDQAMSRKAFDTLLSRFPDEDNNG